MWTPGTHEKDKYVDFKDDGHCYSIDWHRDGDWQRNDISVTGMVKQYFPKFDADYILDAVDASRKPFWMRSKRYKGKTKEQIKAFWKQNGDEARVAGTALHKAIENFYLLQLWAITKDDDEDKNVGEGEEWRQFKEFASECKHVPLNVEWVVYSDQAHSIVGTIDMVFLKHAEGDKLTLKLVDWKRTKAIKMWAQDAGEGPCACVPNANFFHYSLQLNVYKYILEHWYNKGIVHDGHTYSEVEVDSMYIIVFHPRLKRHAKFKVPNMQKIVREMFILRRRSNKASMAYDDDDDDDDDDTTTEEDEEQPGLYHN